ncbi:MAG TPA: metallophosphoesterase [Candidatus Obscuribacterales bacterium]
MEILRLPAKPLKIVLIADIHIGRAQPEPCTRLPERARGLLKYVVQRINTEMRPDLVVQLGDLIEAEDEETDEENYETGLDLLRDLKMPCYQVVGNHDQANLSATKLAGLLDRPKLYYSFDAGAFHFIVIFGQCSDGRAVVFDEQQKWLQQDLAASEKPAIVFTHLPLHDEEERANPSGETEPIAFSAEQKRIIRSILAGSGKVRAVFCGHLHKNELHTVDDICYVAIQSLVQNISRVRKDASETFAVVSLAESATKVEVEGMEPAEYHF